MCVRSGEAALLLLKILAFAGRRAEVAAGARCYFRKFRKSASVADSETWGFYGRAHFGISAFNVDEVAAIRSGSPKPPASAIAQARLDVFITNFDV